MILPQTAEQVGVERRGQEGDGRFAEFGPFRSKGRLGDIGIGAAQGVPRLALVQHVHGKALAGQLPGDHEPGQSRADDGQTLRAGAARHEARLRRGCFKNMALQRADGQRAAQIAAQTGILTGMVADGGHHGGQGQVTFQQLAGIVVPARGNMIHEGAHIHLQGTGGAAARHGLLCAAGLHGMEFGLIHGGVSRGGKEGSKEGAARICGRS